MLDFTPATSDHALQQDPAFFAALTLCGQSPLRLPNGMTLLSQRMFGMHVAMLPRAVPPPNLQDQLRQIGLGRTPVILSPDRPCKTTPRLRLKPALTTAYIDLTTGPQAHRAKLHVKWRNQLVRAEASPLQIRSSTFAPDHPLLHAEQAQATSRGYVNWPHALTAAFAQVAPDQTRLFTAYMRGTPVAHMLFLRHGSRATYHIGHTTALGRVHHAHNLLLWTACCWLAELGHTTLDLGQIHPKTPTLNRFKLRSGADNHLTGGTWLHWRPFAR